ncbi:hypothetical protein ACFL4Z_03290 [candidate division KSB1 bacterium]
MKNKSIHIYGAAGLLIIIAAEVLLFYRNQTIGVWFTPIIWSGYILFVDSIIYRKKGESFISSHFPEFVILLFLSVGFWLIFEGYNLFIRNWHYINLPENLTIRYIGFFWSFATIYPAIFETRDLLETYGFFKKVYVPKREACKMCLTTMFLIGLIFLIFPFVKPSEYLAPIVWTGFVFTLEPVNYLLNSGSFLRDLKDGIMQRFLTHFTAGIICGLLWEFWNYFAYTKWIYTVPYWGNVKIFEMPLIGYLGFPAFALECYVMYSTAVIIMKKLNPNFKSYFVKMGEKITNSHPTT